MADPRVDRFFDEDARWRDEARALRQILLGCGLDEDFKWGKPCYARGGKNLAILQRMNDFLALMFFKGALLDDPAGVLVSQGPNSHSALRIELTSVARVRELAPVIEALVQQAIAVEEAGLKVERPELVLVAELQDRLDRDPALREAFEGLTPGRQREYHLHISGAKQASTRERRVDSCLVGILAGKGLRD